MPLPKTRIEISGPEHSKKTTLAILVSEYLSSLGVNVVLQKADPQFEDKISLEHNELEKTVCGLEVFISELQTR